MEKKCFIDFLKNECTQYHSTMHTYVIKMVFYTKTFVFFEPAKYHAVLQQPLTINITLTQ